MNRVISAKADPRFPDECRNVSIEIAACERNRTSVATKKAMAERKASGAQAGNPKIRSETQPAGVAANANKAIQLVEALADLLESNPESSSWTLKQVADKANSAGLVTTHDRPFNKSRIGAPLAKARRVLEQRTESHYKPIAAFGQF